MTILPEGMEVSPEEPLGPSVSSGGPPASLELARVERKQARKEQWRLLRRRPGFIVGSLILLFWLVCAIGGDRITPFDPINDLGIPLQRPGAEHWFGTDDVGRDVLSRVMAGARDVLIVSFIAASIAVIVGSMLGLIMGYVRGVADEAIGRVIEAILSIPVVLIGLLIISVLGASKPVVIFTVAALFTPIVARTVRTAVLNEAQLDYVEAAKLRGESGLFIMTREILPNVMPVIVVEFTVRVGYADLHGGHALVPRCRHPAAIAGLGADHLGDLQPDPGRPVVAHAVPGHRHRVAGDRRQPHRRFHPGGVRVMRGPK